MNALVVRLLAQVQSLRGRPGGRMARLVEVQSFGATTKMAVVEFAGQTLLLSVTRDGIRLLASDTRP